jgi:hypothetical protein
MILVWLPKFRDHVMPYLAQEDMNLPMDSTKYGNTIELGLSIAGGLSIGLAAFGLVGSIIFRKRKLSPEPS